MESSSEPCSRKTLTHALVLEQTQKWKYETDEFSGICEIAKDVMVVKCVFEATTNRFYDVLQIDDVIRSRLDTPVSVERLAEQLAADVPGVYVTVMGRAKTHGWITSAVAVRHV